MKPEIFRLLTLFLILGSACVLQIFKDYSANCLAPVLIGQLTILAYFIHLLFQKTRQRKRVSQTIDDPGLEMQTS